MKKTYEGTPVKKISEARIAIVQSAWHREHSDRMVAACKDILERAEAHLVETFLVPGAYEIPLTAKKLARLGVYDAIVAFGIIVKGETDHYEVILQTCIRELGKVMYDFEVPIIMEILPVLALDHAIARTEGAGNKGIEAGEAAVEIVSLHRALHRP